MNVQRQFRDGVPSTQVLNKSITLTTFNYLRRGLFEKMRNGTTAEGECTLRLKMYEEGGSNFNMFDQVAYRCRLGVENASM